MSNTLASGAGSMWWGHAGTGAATRYSFPLSSLGTGTTPNVSAAVEHATSLLYLARAAVVHSITVTVAAAGDTATLGLVDAAGTFTALPGLAFPCDTAITWRFPGGLRIMAPAAATLSANLAVKTTGASSVTVSYRKVA